MRSVFGPRGVILIWAFLTATIGLGVQLKQVAGEIRAAHPETFVAGFFDSVNSIPPKAINAFFDAVHFVPAAVILTLGGFPIQTLHLVLLLGTIVLVLVLMVFGKAIRSDTLADDLIMLVLWYLVFQISLGIWARMDDAIENFRPEFVCALMLATVVILAWRGGIKDDSRIFWKSIFECYLVLLFFFPNPVVPLTAALFDLLAEFGSALHSSAGFVVWSGAGMVMAVWLLYGLGSKPKKPTAAVIEEVRKKINEDLDKAKG